MKRLRDYSWKPRYSGRRDDLINDFYVPALERSRFYYRSAGYFRSSAIAVAFRGISAFIENGEKMFFIVGASLTEKDTEALNRGHVGIDEVLYKKWEECKSDFDSNLIMKRFQLLSWLIANDKLKFRIAINKDGKGRYLSSDKSYYHPKILIFEDYEGDKIQLDGSINETMKAWINNRENFAVHKSWIVEDNKYVKDAQDEFDELWRKHDPQTEIVDIPEAIKKDLITFAPSKRPQKDFDVDFSEENIMKIIRREGKKDLRKYQKEAIDALHKNNFVGILEMATGTGKTFTALKAVSQLELKSKFLFICVPQKELAEQWKEECQGIFRNIKHDIILCYSDNPSWKNALPRFIRKIKRENKLGIIIVLLPTLRGNSKQNYFIEETNSVYDDSYLIIDEVHEAGSYENRKIFPKLEKIKVRIGLSATPNRVWDNEGNEAITSFFDGEKIFSWDMKKAINPPEGYEPCLCKYLYHLFEAHLNETELKRYEGLSKQISKKIAMLTQGGKVSIKHISDEKSLTLLLNKRAEIIKTCEDKFRVLKNIIDKYPQELSKCLIYCNDKKHMGKTSKILWKKGLSSRQYDGDIKGEQRRKILDNFKKSNLRFIVAIKCLDQGIDIKSCNSAILLTSSKNPREYIQRRGRVLRLHESKDFAHIFDILVLPYPIDGLISGKVGLYEYEYNLFINQLERIKLFIENSENYDENYLNLLKYEDIKVIKNENE